MFGLNLYAIYAMIAISLFCGGFVSGCQHEQSAQEKVIRDKEHKYQESADKIRIEKDAQIEAINNQLINTISELRKRPSRSEQTSNGQTVTGCNGSQLFSDDAIFLTRFASTTETLKTALNACYQQYDSIK